jgi:hypothetical protein
MNIDIETIQKYVSLSKDVITGLSALIAATIAILGLQEWKKQLKGKNEYELAQRMLRATYKVRDSIAWVRNPFQSAGEISQAMKESNIEGDPVADPTIYIRSEGAVYQKRWQKVQEAFVELESITLEAEAIWGQAVKENLKPLQQCVVTLAANVQIHLRNLEKPPRKYDADAENKISAIIYGLPDNSSNNFFSDEISAAVGKMECFLKLRLKV